MARERERGWEKNKERQFNYYCLKGQGTEHKKIAVSCFSEVIKYAIQGSGDLVFNEQASQKNL